MKDLLNDSVPGSIGSQRCERFAWKDTILLIGVYRVDGFQIITDYIKIFS